MKHYPIYIILVCIFAFCQNAQTEKESSTTHGLFQSKASADSGIDFQNKVVDQDNFNVLTYRNYYNGGGVAVGDINNDNLPDVFFTANMDKNQLYLNKGNLQFENISASAKIEGSMSWSTGVTMADVNGDGLLDIYVCNSGDVKGANKLNELYINNGDLSFNESAKQYGLDDNGFSTHASFFDFDGDGDLDCYLVNNSFKDPDKIDFKNERNNRDKNGGDKLFENIGNTFSDISESAGIYGSEIGFGLGVSVSDINGDNLPDIYISNDFWERDYIYINNGDKTFTEELTNRVSYTSTASMGADIADLDNNGAMDIFSTDMLPASSERTKRTTTFNEYSLSDRKYRSDYHYQYTQNCLQFNDGNGYFTESSFQAGVAATDWSWAALAFDFDNDSWKDIFVSNGVYHDITDLDFANFIDDKEEVKKIVMEKGRFKFVDFLPFLPSTAMANYAFVNQHNGTFKNEAHDLGLGAPGFSNGSAYADLDNDGDLDLLINNVNNIADLYENKTNELTTNNYIKISCKGKGKNPFGIGATVNLQIEDHTLSFQNYQSRGFQSATEPVLTIGIGDAKKIEKLEIIWPSNFTQILHDVPADTLIILSEDNAKIAFNKISTQNKEVIFVDKTQEVLQNKITHTENVFSDFDYEKLAIRMFSTEGPELLKGDINGDDKEDLILLGAENDVDKVLIQNSNNKFELLPQTDLNQDSIFESTCGLLIDLDNDDDLDVIIGVGGNNPQKKADFYFVRTYLNDGKGHFKKTVDYAPRAIGNISSITAIKLDPTQSPALFMTGQIIPGNYGLPPRNFLFRQEGVNWIDITNKEIGQTGMINDAVAVDIDGDNDEELIVVGEFSPIKIFDNENGTLKLKGTVKDSEGLWQSINKADLDGDGDLDFVITNWGTNSKLQASNEKPLELYVNDFDKNSKSEPILIWHAPEDKEPNIFASKMDISTQLPHLKKRVLKHKAYAEKSMEDLFNAEELKGALKLKTKNLESSVLLNQGDFIFKLMPLPNAAQMSPLFVSNVIDIDNDDILDIILGGNLYGVKPEIGRLDGTKAVVLKGIGDGQFIPVDPNETGLKVEGEIRDIVSLKLENEKEVIFFARNNDRLIAYEKK